MKHLKYSFLLMGILLVGGCAIKPIHFDGKSATYQHDPLDFAPAMLQAKEMCSSVNKGIKHESTSCSRERTCISTFICM